LPGRGRETLAQLAAFHHRAKQKEKRKNSEQKSLVERLTYKDRCAAPMADGREADKNAS
jgi:hypothetical protein